MALKFSASTALLLSLNLLYFTLVSSHHYRPPPTTLAPLPPSTTPAPLSLGGCPNLDGCVNILDGLPGVVIGLPPNRECCNLIPGVLDVEATVCICAAIRVHVLEILLIELDVALRLILNHWGKIPRVSDALLMLKELHAIALHSALLTCSTAT